MSRIVRASQFAALGTALLWSASASAGNDPKGVWFDQDGRGAVEIKDCDNGKGLCGFVVHVADPKNAKRCGTQILGNVTANGGGWIYSPSRGRKYTVALKRLTADKLRVVGNASSSLFSKTFTWKRAPGDIELCGEYANLKRGPAFETPTTLARNEVPVENTRATVERAPASRRSVMAPPPSIAAAEEAELEAGASRSRQEPVEQEPVEEAKEQYGDVPEDADAGDKEPIENRVTEVLDELIDKANEYTGKMKRKCKFHIPYVDRVVMIPCKD